jgi:hypothetical protein
MVLRLGNMGEFVKPEEMERLRGQLNDLLDLDAGITAKELDFLEELTGWGGAFTLGQANWLDRIYERLV